MTQVSQPRRSRILPPSAIAPEELHRRREQKRALALRCRPLFERWRSVLMETHYNWFIAIDPDSEQYLLDPTLKGITQQIRDAYSGNEVKLTIFRLNDTGTCGRLWV
jgi:hypothetical protein